MKNQSFQLLLERVQLAVGKAAKTHITCEQATSEGTRRTFSSNVLHESYLSNLPVVLRDLPASKSMWA